MNFHPKKVLIVWQMLCKNVTLEAANKMCLGQWRCLVLPKRCLGSSPLSWVGNPKQLKCNMRYRNTICRTLCFLSYYQMGSDLAMSLHCPWGQKASMPVLGHLLLLCWGDRTAAVNGNLFYSTAAEMSAWFLLPVSTRYMQNLVKSRCSQPPCWCWVSRTCNTILF